MTAIFRIWQPEKEGQSKELDALQIIKFGNKDSDNVMVSVSKFRNDKNGTQRELKQRIVVPLATLKKMVECIEQNPDNDSGIKDF